MNRVSGILEQLRRLSRREIEREVEDELAAHVEEIVRENVSAGMTADEAKAVAEARFGDPARLRAEGVTIRRRTQRGRRLRDAWGGLWGDVNYALRVTSRTPGFSVITVSTLALGMGAAAAVFSVMDAVLLRPLPYHEPDRVVALSEVRPDGRQMFLSQANFLDWRENTRAFTDIAAIERFAPNDYVNLTGGAEAVRVPAHRVSQAFFEVLGVDAALGRTFVTADDRAGAQPVVVLGDAIWRRAFGSDRGIIGRTIRIDDVAHTVVGVMPRGFTFHLAGPGEPELWRPQPLRPENNTVRGARSLDAVARLRPGVTVEEAQAELDAITTALVESYPSAMTSRGQPWGASVIPLHDRIVTPEARSTLFVIFGGVVLLLMISWINVANLLLAQTTARAREVAVRTALGAGRWRIMRQFLTHAVVLSAMGGILALGLTRLSIPALLAAAPSDDGGVFSTGFIPLLARANISTWVVVMTVATAMITAGVCGIVPALRAASRPPGEGWIVAIRRGARRQPTGSILAAAEVSLALVLLIGVGLLVETLVHISRIPVGFETEGVDVVQIRMTPDRYTVPADVNTESRSLTPDYHALVLEIQRQISALPGVRAAGAANLIPLQTAGAGISFSVPGFEREGARMSRGLPVHGSTLLNLATPGYFRAIGQRIVSGRPFVPEDEAAGSRVVIIDRGMLDQGYWDSPDPLKRPLLVGVNGGVGWQEAEIVGVAETRLSTFYKPVMSGEIPRAPILYMPYADAPPSFAWFSAQGYLTVNFVARRDPGVESVVDAMRGIVQRADPETPITYADQLRDYIRAGQAEQRFPLLLIGVLAAVSSLLALSGVYGVISFGVSQRTHEVGVRLALGARSDEIVRMIVREGVQVAVLGSLVGIAAAMGVTRVLSAWLFGVSPTDPLLFGGLAFAMVAVASLAAWVPAHRATHVDPVESLAVE